MTKTFLSTVTPDEIEAGDSLTIMTGDRRYGIVVMSITKPMNGKGARLVSGLVVGHKTRCPSQGNAYKSFWTDEALIQRYEFE